MTREEAIEVNKILDYTKKVNSVAYKVLKETLDNEPCEDAVSRAKAKEEARNLCLETCYDNKKVVEMLDELPPVTPTQKWITVGERLPMNDDACCDDDVLVSCEDGFVRIGFCMGYDELGNRKWCVADKYSEVIAWMPLPEPYKAESEG